MYAVVTAGGKQYTVTVGQRIDVERLPVAEGETIELDKVLMVVGDEGNTTVGSPLVTGAKVTAQVMSQFRADKVIAFKYKNKTRYRRKLGHKQPLTRLAILGITTGLEQEVTENGT